MAELVFSGSPWNELGVTGWDAVKALCKPGVNIERHGTVGKQGDSRFVERNGVGHKAFEILLAEPDSCGPQNPLAIILWEPELKAADDGDLDCGGFPVMQQTEPEVQAAPGGRDDLTRVGSGGDTPIDRNLPSKKPRNFL